MVASFTYIGLCALLALALPQTNALPVEANQPKILRRLNEDHETSMLLPMKCAKSCASTVKYYSACQEGLSLFPRETTACQNQFCDRVHWSGLHSCLSCVVTLGWMSPMEALAELEHADDACKLAGAGGLWKHMDARVDLEAGESPLTRMVMQAPKKRFEVVYETFEERDSAPAPAPAPMANMTTTTVPMPSGMPNMTMTCPVNATMPMWNASMPLNTTMPMPMSGSMPMPAMNGTTQAMNGTMPAWNGTMPNSGTVMPNGCTMMPMPTGPAPSPGPVITRTRTMTMGMPTPSLASKKASARSLPTLGLRWKM